MTGADGFIGSHLTERLLRDGWKVRALAQYNSFGGAGWLDTLTHEVRSEIDICFGDVRDAGQMSEFVSHADVILHLAALISIPFSYEAPSSYVATNVQGTLNILEGARRARVGKLIATSTSEVYGTPESIPITTQHRLQAQSPYAATKIAADQLCASYGAAFDLNVAILRPFNTYGPRQSMRAVIPTILRQMMTGASHVRLGSLHPRRDFTFVSDTVEGFVRMIDAATSPGEVVQLGTGQAVSVGELAELCRAVTGSSADILEESQRVRPANSEVQVLLADPTAARERINWEPQVDLLHGLSETAAWMLEHELAQDPSTYGI